MLRRTFVAAAMTAALLAAGVAQAQTYRAEYRLSTTLGPAFAWGQAGERWIELVREKTQGRINIKLYSGNSLVGGEQTREFTAIRQGVIDMSIGSTINWSPQIKELNLFSLPFLMPDYKAMDALTQGEVGKDLFTILDKRGDVVPLAWGENGFREMSNSKRAITSPADMKGMKFRVVGSPLYNETFTALGANPTQMSWADAQPALASGAVDGQENPLSVFVAAKLTNVGQKHLTLWHYVADPLIFVVNRQVWNSWTPADREAVRQAALQAGRENVDKARKGIAGSDNAVLKQIEASGVTVTHLTPEQREAFVKATRPVYDKWAKTIGADLVKKAEAAIAKR
ncbi:tripartite ATP-independent transporter DctP family solute receptor [Azonexus fungiphilus]|jgi:tripartite ATP-independent transporter DctP family solute receptor|uniref:Tripartite ATP-independent transporter DctP family solute receptor n=1 Tax=Azonexus fungiphilus TaxID=146940 RepID=A0A495VLP6_9RHOO|nr:DctP family TRAP transporter solute-binding subunit [Azonexus fungiphilus]RKT50321.1 tripartite ATP-independent transporter DctP family solute receptor [Azonexus fungiphilus]